MTNIAINELTGAPDGLSCSISHYFNLLQSLSEEEVLGLVRRSDQDSSFVGGKTASNTTDASRRYYQALANYGLGTVLYKVLSLSEKENQYYLTTEGFVSSVEWFQLKNAHQRRIFQFKTMIAMDNNFSEKLPITLK